MQLLASLKKKLYMGFRATLNFRKFKVALNVQNFFNFAKNASYPFRHLALFEILMYKLKLGVF